MVNSTKYIYIAGVVVLLSIGAYFFVNRTPIDPSDLGHEPEATSTVSSPTSTPTSTILGTVKKNPDGHRGFTYSAAVNAFAGRRIQFDANCAMNPPALSLRNGTNVMFDNRSDVGRYFALDGIRSYLPARDFQILTLSSKRLPHTISVDCGSGRNNGQIILN